MDLPNWIEAKYIVNVGMLFAAAYIFFMFNISKIWAVVAIGISFVYFNNSFIDKSAVIPAKPPAWQSQQPLMNTFSQNSFLDPSTGEFVSREPQQGYPQFSKPGDYGFKGGGN